MRRRSAAGCSTAEVNRRFGIGHGYFWVGEGGGAPFAANTPWGLTATTLVYDPPASDPSQIATREVAAPAGSTAQPYRPQVEPARKLKNLKGIPIAYVVAERSGRNGEPAIAFLKQAGCDAELLNLKDKGIIGNGHFMMLETNRRQVFDAIRGWIDQKLPARTQTAG